MPKSESPRSRKSAKRFWRHSSNRKSKIKYQNDPAKLKMDCGMENKERIAIVLRMLLGKDGRYPMVRFVGSTNTPCGDCVKVSLPNDYTDEVATEYLSKAVKSKIDGVCAVCVEGVGRFEIISTLDVAGRVAGKVAIVTGAAQGFGLEIVQDLVRQGAFVALADINEAETRRQAELLQKHYGTNRTMAVAMNVTDHASITAAVSQVVAHYGGLDVFISNAGVLKAASVKTQPEKDFDFVTAVNYKGYFLCTQVVAPVMALQHKAESNYRSDIIQINSKSGLVGSNRNGAYAGGKFGGIGLTQSFALELIEDGIKVNSICPGNFFDGPLWSNPDNGLFVQYLRTGKIPGAKTIEDVKRAYESKVPMGRGCTTPDVMVAVYYLIDQKYETGQAVPVTGGQVMLH
jgi:sorbitol-6-phosphate 2-dehydrogenase